MRVRKVKDPVYTPDSKGGPRADGERHATDATWECSGDRVRHAYTQRTHDDDCRAGKHADQQGHG